MIQKSIDREWMNRSSVAGRGIVAGLILTVVLSLAGLTGCSKTITSDEADITNPLVAKQRWQENGSDNYEMLIHLQASRFPQKLYEVTVENDVIVEVRLVESGEVIDHPAGMPTITQIFAVIEQYEQSDEQDYVARYDPALGYPDSTIFNVSSQGDDGAVGYQIESVTLR